EADDVHAREHRLGEDPHPRAGASDDVVLAVAARTRDGRVAEGACRDRARRSREPAARSRAAPAHVRSARSRARGGGALAPHRAADDLSLRHDPRRDRLQRAALPVHERRIDVDDLEVEVVGRGAVDPLLVAHLGLRGPTPDRWEDILFLDTETTGLSGGTGTYVFLIGVAHFAAGQLVLRQHLLHDI